MMIYLFCVSTFPVISLMRLASLVRKYIISEIVFSVEIPVDERIKQFWIEVVTLRFMCIILRKDFDRSFGEVEGMMRTL